MPQATIAKLELRIAQLERNFYDLQEQVMPGVRQINSIAKLALAAMESPSTYLHPRNLAETLNAICWISESTEGCVSSNADDAGCPYRDEHSERRFAAFRAAEEA